MKKIPALLIVAMLSGLVFAQGFVPDSRHSLRPCVTVAPLPLLDGSLYGPTNVLDFKIVDPWMRYAALGTVWDFQNHALIRTTVDYQVSSPFSSIELLINGEARFEANQSGLAFFGARPVAKPGPLTASNDAPVDLAYGAEERDVIDNLRARIAELEERLQALGLLE